MVALRRQGMTTRHWEAISKEIGGAPLNPELDDEFCLTTCINRDLMSHIDFCIR
jgi:hypothetical protein